MADASRILRVLLVLVCLFCLSACAVNNDFALRATARPIIRITPAPAQDADATATAFARRIVPTPTPAGVYVVQAGDTLSKIATDYNTTIAELMALNNLSDPNKIVVGQRLIIQALDATATAGPDASVTSSAEPSPAESASPGPEGGTEAPPAESPTPGPSPTPTAVSP